MTYPNWSLVHGEKSPYTGKKIVWEIREEAELPMIRFRHCSWCGGLHPKDFLDVLEDIGSVIELADMKYGWPHKFYVDRYLGRNCHAKFYNEHLLDLVGEPEFDILSKAIEKRTGIRFSIKGGQLYWEIMRIVPPQIS